VATKIMETATQLGLAAVTGNVTQAMSGTVVATSVPNGAPVLAPFAAAPRGDHPPVGAAGRLPPGGAP